MSLRETCTHFRICCMKSDGVSRRGLSRHRTVSCSITWCRLSEIILGDRYVDMALRMPCCRLPYLASAMEPFHSALWKVHLRTGCSQTYSIDTYISAIWRKGLSEYIDPRRSKRSMTAFAELSTIVGFPSAEKYMMSPIQDYCLSIKRSLCKHIPYFLRQVLNKR